MQRRQLEQLRATQTIATDGNGERRRIAAQIARDFAQRCYTPLGRIPGDERACERDLALPRVREHVLPIDTQSARHGLDDLLQRQLAAIDTEVTRQVLQELGTGGDARVVLAAMLEQRA